MTVPGQIHHRKKFRNMSGKPLDKLSKIASLRHKGVNRQVLAIMSSYDDTKSRDVKSRQQDFESLNMESVVKTLERMGYNPTEELVKDIDNLSQQQRAKVNQGLAEMAQRELVAERKEIKHEGLGLLDVLEAQARAQLSDEDDD